MALHEIESRTQIESNDSDDGYIDMDISLFSSSSSSSSSFISFAFNNSPPQSREFEFQMCSSAVDSGESTSYPADELFYKGQLLPLHLPPRLQMVQKLLASSSSAVAATDTPCAAVVSSPRRFSSGEIVVNGLKEQSFFEISNPGNSWSKKIKHLSISQKLKASRAYFRSLFSKPSCSDSSEIKSKSKLEITNPSKSLKKKNPNTNINPPLIHRRSFSGVIRHSSSSSSSASSLSSSFSVGSNGSLDLMRSSNASSEIDNSIEGAIKHCKESFTTRRSNVTESEMSSSRTSVSTCGDLE